MVALRICSAPTSRLRPFPESPWVFVAASKPAAQPLIRSTAALRKAATAMFLRAMDNVPFDELLVQKSCSHKSTCAIFEVFGHQRT